MSALGTKLGKLLKDANESKHVIEAMTGDLFGTSPHMLHRSDSPDTSVDAAHAVDSTRLEELVYVIVRSYTNGCTQDDVLARREVKGLPYSSVTARFSALLRKGLIEDTGERRPGRSGRSQRVLRASSKSAGS